MSELLNIPYFKQLAEENGEDWLSSLFELLETESYDFSQFQSQAPDIVSLSIDDAIALDVADLNVEADDSAAAGASDTDATTILDTSDETSSRQAGLAKMAAEMSAKEDPQAAASTGETTETDKERSFDNQPSDGPSVPHNSEMIVRYLHEWLQLFNPNERYSASDSEEGVVVGLNDAYTDLKLSAFDDKIYTDSGTADVTLNGGDGSDTLYLTQGGLKADLGGTSDFGKYGGTVEIRNVENVVGSDGDDRIFGNVDANKLVGRGGDDHIDGGAGDDTITGGGGTNTLIGGAGIDTITGGNGVDTIDGGLGNDKITAGNGDDDISGGDGDDTIDAGGGDDTIAGGSGNDTITAGDGDNTITGGSGTDTITAGDGDDTIDGGDGTDTITAGAGDDTVDGGAGNDTVSAGDGKDKVDGGDGDDTINGEAGDDTLNGDAGKDTIHGNDGADKINGGDDADKLYGDAGNDTIDGGADADTIDGGDGDDTLLGGAGADTITAGAGADKLTGGAGADTMTGGAGADTYIYTASSDSGTASDSFDIITDFDVSADKFDLTALLANDTFDFVAAEGGAFTGTGAEVRWDKDGGATLIEIDINGDGTADMKIKLDDSVDLTASNFSL
jgi:Ca2+-binding RTX toxin-like protein